MLEIKGNLWHHSGTICITTNGIVRSNGRLVMGAGIALGAKERFEDIDLVLGEQVKRTGNRPYYLKQYDVISFPTKHDWRNKSSIGLILKSAQIIKNLATIHKLDSIGMPPPGCGNGQLKWSFVKMVLSPILDNRFVIYLKEDFQ